MLGLVNIFEGLVQEIRRPKLPGSQIGLFSVPDPESTLNKNSFLRSRNYDMIFFPFRIPYPGVKKAPDPRSGSANKNNRKNLFVL
jgi:hypothetical protein